VVGVGSGGGPRTVGVAKLRKKFVFLPPREPETLTPVGVTDLDGGSLWSSAIYLPRYAMEGNLRSLGLGDGGALCVFLLLGGIISEPTSAWGPWKDGMLLRMLAGGRCVQFGNDDVASKVWVAVRASLVSLTGVSDGSSGASPCCCGV
jgi:hypothetical protein